MKFVSMVDIASHNIISIDANAFTLRLEIDGAVRETRLKPYHAAILYSLFTKHPSPLTYEEIIALLKQYNLVVTDLTRMHRKLSEIRGFMNLFHHGLGRLVYNTRGVGYSLPLRLKSLQGVGTASKLQFKNKAIARSVNTVRSLIEAAIKLTAEYKIVPNSSGFISERNLCSQVIAENITIFNKEIAVIMREIRLHEAEFIYIRLEYLLANLRTYVGLARVSEYPISEVQWLDWFSQEVWLLFDSLEKLLKEAGV